MNFANHFIPSITSDDSMGHEIKMALHIIEFPMHPSAITEQLGIQPTQTWLTGDLITQRGTIKYKFNGWELSSGNKTDDSFEDHVNGILEQIHPKMEAVRELCEAYYCELACALYIDTEAEESVPSVHIDAEPLRALAQIGVHFDLDIIKY